MRSHILATVKTKELVYRFQQGATAVHLFTQTAPMQTFCQMLSHEPPNLGTKASLWNTLLVTCLLQQWWKRQHFSAYLLLPENYRALPYTVFYISRLVINAVCKTITMPVHCVHVRDTHRSLFCKSMGGFIPLQRRVQDGQLLWNFSSCERHTITLLCLYTVKLCHRRVIVYTINSH